MTHGRRWRAATARPTPPTGSGGEDARITSGRRVAQATIVPVNPKET